MKRIVNKSKTFKEAEEWDILQQINMTPDERQRTAKELKERYYGKNQHDGKDLQCKQVFSGQMSVYIFFHYGIPCLQYGV